MTTKEIENNIEKVLKSSPNFHTQLLDIENTEYGYNFRLHSYDLKRGGYQDDDENDYELEEQLQNLFIKNLKLICKDMYVEEWFSSEKGFWGGYIKLYSDKNKNKKINILKEKENKLNKQIEDFCNKVFLKIKNQKSSKKSCSHCNSTLNISYLKNYFCPVCSYPLFSNTEQNKINNIKEKIKSIKEEINIILNS